MANDESSSLLRLPAEIQYLIVNELPLSSHLIYRTQVCSTLRMLFNGHLRFAKSYRFDLVDWRRAQREIREILARQNDNNQLLASQINDKTERSLMTTNSSIWDTSPTLTPRPAPAKVNSSPISYPELTSNNRQLQPYLKVIVHQDHPDVDLFIRCMQLLGKMAISPSSDLTSGPLPRVNSDKFTVLSLLSRSGFRVASLIQLLETQQSLHEVETIFMTSASFIDAGLWTMFTPPKAKKTRLNLSSGCTTHFELDFAGSTCVDTAAIVIPGPLSEKGQGLRSGFKCLCFSEHINKLAMADAGEVPTFHVIFHDYYTEEEAIGTQDMLENSDISCNTCKQKIRF